jgi:hypothetical protein
MKSSGEERCFPQRGALIAPNLIGVDKSLSNRIH